MADEGIFATTAEVQRKVGAFASGTSNSEAYINDFITQAESYINVKSGKNWSDDYAGLNVDVKGLLKEAASNLAAIYVILYDTQAYTVLEETENIINFLWAKAEANIELLEEGRLKKFMSGA